jgi:hypothetical protein
VAFPTNRSHVYSSVQLNEDEIGQFIKILLYISSDDKKKSLQIFHEENNRPYTNAVKRKLNAIKRSK